MKIGLNLRNWGPYATPDQIAECARIADQSSLDSLWVNDHIGLPHGEWNNDYGISLEMGSILDPLAVLSFVAAVTTRISIGTAVLVVPYRPALITAKWVASIQALSKERLLLGVGPGYLDEEFKALGVLRSRRGRITDDALQLLHDAFANEVITLNGQALEFNPRPRRPPLLIGGAPNIAIPRAVRLGDGWMPVGILPPELKKHIADMDQLALKAGREKLQVVAMKTLPLDSVNAAIELVRAYRDAGATHLVHTQSYSNPREYQAIVDSLAQVITPALAR